MNQDLFNKIEEALETIRPYLKADGGNVELVDIEDSTVKVELTGSCKTCSMNMMTLRAGIEETIKRAAPEIKEVIAVSF